MSVFSNAEYSSLRRDSLRDKENEDFQDDETDSEHEDQFAGNDGGTIQL